jgi:ParB-like chromosome segregation protein Spo0J
MRIIDGTHRVAAARLRGETTVLARLYDGSERDAFALAVRSNIEHGLPLTRADRLAAASEILRSHANWSDRVVAAAAGLSATTVAGIRRALGPDAVAQEKRTGADGRLRPVDVGAGRERARQAILKSPQASLRQLARTADVSPNTIRSVRRQMLNDENTAQPECPGPLPERATPAKWEPRPAVARRPIVPEPDAQPVPDASALPVSTLDAALHRLRQDPSVRLTEAGRLAIRWFQTHAVRPGEWETVIDGLPPHSLFLLAGVARECANAWDDLASGLAEQMRRTG